MGALAGVIKPLHHGGHVCAAIFDQGNQPGQGKPVTGGKAAQQLLEPVIGGAAHLQTRLYETGTACDAVVPEREFS